MILKDILPKKDFELFEKQFPEKSIDELEKIEKNIMTLYKNTVIPTKRIIERGFSEDFKNINVIEWVSFVSKLMPQIEKLKNVKVGKDKLDLLVSYASFVIIKSLPIDHVLKELLVQLVKEAIPPIADGIIYASKKLHTFIIGIFKKLKKIIKCDCMKKQEENKY